MTAFAQQTRGTAASGFDDTVARPTRRPSRWSISNWPVRWKVFAIVLVPLLLAGAFGGLRIYSGWNDARGLKLAADRAQMVPAIEEYVGSLEAALLANSTGGDAQTALTAFDASKNNLQRELAATDAVPDVATGVQSLLDGGQGLLEQVMANSIDLRDRVTTYAPILLTAEDAVNGSVRVDDERIRAQTQGVSRAMGARGQMLMQQLLVNLGAEIPEPELRTSMITLAGTEPSTLFGMVQVLGVGSSDAQTLQAEMVKRMALMSDPAVPLVNNPEITQSIQATSQIAGQVIDRSTSAVTSAVRDQASAKRTEAIRDTAIVAAAILVALLLVTLVARTLVNPLRRLRDGALRVAHEDLAREIERVRAGGEVGPVQPLPVLTTEEIGQVAHAVDELHEQAVLLAGEQSRLQVQVGDMFETLSRRSRSLVDQQLSLIDRLERNEDDPERLDSLFRLDHLAARMRRNGANLLVLAGSQVPREQADPVAVAALVNAAASEVEDYTRVATADVPDSEIVGLVAGDLVHLLAELLDNALRYSPPTSQVQVSAVHTGNGGLVIEVGDAGLGMTEVDLRVANSRLQSGGEVNPYTARHMGLFVVGRLAAQHGLVVRLRSTVAGERGSGTTAGVYVPAELLLRGGAPIEPEQQSGDGPATDAIPVYQPPIPAVTHQFDDDGPFAGGPAVRDDRDRAAPAAPVDAPVSFLPQRNPGASGISDIPTGPPGFVELAPAAQVDDPPGWADEDPWPEDSIPAQSPPPVTWEPEPHQPGPEPELLAEPEPEPEPEQRWQPPAPVVRRPEPRHGPTDTSTFFASRAQAAGRHGNGGRPPEPEPTPDDADGSIFSSMLSEWLIDDPHDLAVGADLDWKTVWDKGWSAAEAADDAPVAEHTEEGLPVRQPGARLVPGAADAPEPTVDDGRNGRHANGSRNGDHEPGRAPTRDPEAVRASMSNHFGGVHAGRNRVRDTSDIREPDRE